MFWIERLSRNNIHEYESFFKISEEDLKYLSETENSEEENSPEQLSLSTDERKMTFEGKKASVFFERWKGLFHTQKILKRKQPKTLLPHLMSFFSKDQESFLLLYCILKIFQKTVSPFRQFLQSKQFPKGQGSLDEGISFLPLPRSKSSSEEKNFFTDSTPEEVYWKEVSKIPPWTRKWESFEVLKKGTPIP